MSPSSANSMVPRIRARLPRVLPEFLARQRWFGGKGHTLDAAEVVETIPIPAGRREAFLVLADVHYADHPDETYALPLVPTGGRRALPGNAQDTPNLRLASENGSPETILADALWDKQFPVGLMQAIYGGRRFTGSTGGILASPTQAFRGARRFIDAAAEPSLMRAEQSNTSVRFGERFILKFYRRLAEGTNPDLEIGAFLTDKTSFKYTPYLYGALDYERAQAPSMTLGILQAFVPNQGDAWRYTLDALDVYFHRVTSGESTATRDTMPPRSLTFEPGEIPREVPKLIGDYWDAAALLGRRTAELHLALASDSEDPAFRPEPFSAAYQSSQYDSMRALALQVLRVLEKRLPDLPASVRRDAARLLLRRNELWARFESFVKVRPRAELIRIHGDFHLGQVLRSGSDFFIIDFEGEPARPLAERRAKQCPLRDVAGMLRSFHYAACTALDAPAKEATTEAADTELEAGAIFWQRWVSARFLNEYLTIAAAGRFLPVQEEDTANLLGTFLLEKAVYELGYELNNRPDWVGLPLQGILELLDGAT